MKTFSALCLTILLGVSLAPAAQQEGNPQAAKLAREASQAAKDQRFQDALNDLTESIKIKPDARAYEQRGAIERGINDYDKALADFAEASKLNPGEIKYHNYRAYIYETRGDLDNATAENEAALKINSKNKEALDRKARLQKIKASMGPQQPENAPGVPAPPKKP